MSSAIYENLSLCTLHDNDDYGLIDDAALIVEDGRIRWLGKRSACPPSPAPRIDMQGHLLTPGLIDCHTHLVYGGNRANEFEQRLNGVSYSEIAKAGGGILSTVRATRLASENELLHSAALRLQAMLDEGLTSIEIKSGYGLDHANELKMLRVAKSLSEQCAVNVQTTYLAAHALPPEFAGRADDYIKTICNEGLALVAEQGLASAVDVFCENIGFTLAQSEKLLRAARALGLQVKIHAEQLSDQKGALMAAGLGALSVDHIEFLHTDDVAALGQHGSVAVLLPGAYYYLRETQLPPIAALRAHKVPMALATDHNPGTSPCLSPLLMLNMACTLFRLTPLEALQGLTCHAAQALGLQQSKGRLRMGMDADLAIFDVQHPAELSYRFGHNPCRGRILAGKLFSRA